MTRRSRDPGGHRRRLEIVGLEDRVVPAPLLHVADDAGRLFTVDVPTGAVRPVGTMGAVMTDVAFDLGGNLFGVDGGSTLYKIDPATAATTAVGPVGAAVTALVFAHGGRLYAAGAQLYTIDTATGTGTAVGPLGGFQAAGDLAFDGAGTLYLSTTSNHLVRVDPASGAATPVGPMGFPAVTGLAFGPDRVMYGVTGGSQVLSVDLGTGAGTLVSGYAGPSVSGAVGAGFVGDARTEEGEPNDQRGQATPLVRPADRLTGLMAGPQDVDFFSITLVQGETIRITPNTGADWSTDHASPLFMPRYELLGPDGVSLVASPDGHGVDLQCPASGTYYLRFLSDSMFGLFTGSYAVGVRVDPFDGATELEPNDAAGTATHLPGGRTVRGALADTADVDYFSIDARAGQAIVVKFANRPTANPSTRLIGPAGNVIATDRTGIGLTATLPATGTYKVSLRADIDAGPVTGPYVAQVSVVDKPTGETKAGDNFATAAPWTVGLSVVPGAFLGTGPSLVTKGLTGSYIDESLWYVTSQADWRTTQTVVGTRLDPTINFPTNGWGARAEVGVTGGTDADWQHYSVQWDGFIRIPKSGTRLHMAVDDAARFWIDIDGDGQFAATAPEYNPSNWGGFQWTATGPASSALAAGTYRIRIQFQDWELGNEAFLLWDDPSNSIGTRWNTGAHAVGTLSSLTDVDVYAVDLTATDYYQFRLDGTPGSLAVQGRLITIYNEFGQVLEWATDGAVASTRYQFGPDRSGRHYVTVQALDETGLGGYAIAGDLYGSFPAQRDVPLYYHDYSDFGAAGQIPEMLGFFDARFTPFGAVDTTLTRPAAGTEYVGWRLTSDPARPSGGVGGGWWGNRRPTGDSNGNVAALPTRLADTWYGLMYHEAGHATGLPHTRYPLAIMAYGANTDLFPPGSYFRMNGDPFVSGPKLQNERAYLDWVLQAGRITAEFEKNDSAAAGQDLDPYFTEMTADPDPRNDAVVVAGRLGTTTDKDYFRFTAVAGQTFAFDVEAAEFQLPLDARLDLYDGAGSLLAGNSRDLDRNSGIDSVDPYLTYTFADAGTYAIRVAGEFNTAGSYRLKVTPDQAFDRDAPRVTAAWPDGSAPVDSTRQLLLWFDNPIDAATLTAANVVVRGTATGVHAGTATFDLLNSMLLWTADQPLPADSYTGTLTGVRDLAGNLLDGETDGTLSFPEVSGDGTAGGDFVTSFTVTGPDTSPAFVYYSSYNRHPHNRGQFTLWFTDELDLADLRARGLTLRAAGPDRQFDTVDDTRQPLDLLYDPLVQTAYPHVNAYTPGVPPVGRYRVEGTIHDAAGNPVVLAREIPVTTPVDAEALGTTAAFTTGGLVGTYVNGSLRGYAAQDDWRLTQSVAGTRVDPEIRFRNGHWDDRDAAGITGGIGTNWDDFSVQWDGFVRVTTPDTRLFTSSDDGSRMWIDLNADDTFDATGPEYVSNNWGYPQGTNTGPGSVPLAPGVYRIRIQYEDGFGGNEMFLTTDDPAGPDLAREGYTHGPLVAGLNVAPNSVRTNFLPAIDVTFGGSVDPATITAGSFVVRYSPDPGFFDPNDVILTERDGHVSWDPVHNRATFEPATSFKNGHYLIELDGGPGGIADPWGRPLDGEYVDSTLPGNTSPALTLGAVSGDGRPGGDHRAYFSLNAIGVQSSVRADNSPTGVDTVRFVVTFTKTVTGVDATDFVLATTGLTGAAITNIQGSGKVYTVTVRTGTGEGTLRLDVLDDESVRDGDGTPLGGPGVGNGLFVDGESYAIDRTVTVREDDRQPRGLTVETLLRAATVTDADPAAKRGMAVVTVAGSGRWDYSADVGKSWRSLAGVAESRARLLRPADKVRFVPAKDFVGTATFTYRAWDQTAGKAGGTFDLTTPGMTGGGGAFSAVPRTAAARIVPVNDPPVLDVGGEPSLDPVAPGTADPPGELVRSILGTAGTDVDGNALGMAVVGVKGGGIWQFQLAGSGTWAAIGPVLTSSARPLGPLDRVRFLPDDGVTGVAKLTFRAWDGSSGTAGKLMRPAGTAFSKAVEVASLAVTNSPPPANNAPDLDDTGTPTLTSVPEDTRSPAGDAVGGLLTSLVSDADAGALQGIAVVGLTQADRGTWQFSTTSGESWRAIGTPSQTAALLLRDTDLIRFVPGRDFKGTATIAYHAWDRTRGTAGARADLTVAGGTGGTSPFSTAVGLASVFVSPENDAPVLNTTSNARLGSILPNAVDPAGDLVSTLVGRAASDVDGDALGIAVTGATAPGTWWYQPDGSTGWIDLGPVSVSSARLLGPADRVRLVPAAGFVGVARLTYKAWDQTAGAPGDLPDTLVGTAFSRAAETAALAINGVEERPILNPLGTPALLPVTVGDADPPGDLVSALVGPWATDLDPGAELGIAVGVAASTDGAWQVMTNGSSWEPLESVSTAAPWRLRGTHRIRFVPKVGFMGKATFTFRAWDAASPDPDGPLALSAATTTAMVTVNRAPTLSG